MAQLEYGTENISILEAGSILPELPGRLADEDRAVAITRHGKPVLAVMSWDLFESITETLEIMTDNDMMASMQQGIEDAREGNLVPLERVAADLDA